MSKALGSIQNVFFVFVLATFVVGLIGGAYFLGFSHAQEAILNEESTRRDNIVANLWNRLSASKESREPQEPDIIPSIIPTVVITGIPTVPPVITWGGPELWEAVNERRVKLGVNSLGQRDELCTIASIRLNELLARGELDAHEGFSNMAERRADLRWIFEKYSIAEFLVSGATSAENAVSLWENTLGHKKLLTGGEYVWGCIYAQAGFGVAITAF